MLVLALAGANMESRHSWIRRSFQHLIPCPIQDRFGSVRLPIEGLFQKESKKAQKGEIGLSRVVQVVLVLVLLVVLVLVVLVVTVSSSV